MSAVQPMEIDHLDDPTAAGPAGAAPDSKMRDATPVVADAKTLNKKAFSLGPGGTCFQLGDTEIDDVGNLSAMQRLYPDSHKVYVHVVTPKDNEHDILARKMTLFHTLVGKPIDFVWQPRPLVDLRQAFTNAMIPFLEANKGPLTVMATAPCATALRQLVEMMDASALATLTVFAYTGGYNGTAGAEAGSETLFSVLDYLQTTDIVAVVDVSGFALTKECKGLWERVRTTMSHVTPGEPLLDFDKHRSPQEAKQMREFSTVFNMANLKPHKYFFGALTSTQDQALTALYKQCLSSPTQANLHLYQAECERVHDATVSDLKHNGLFDQARYAAELRRLQVTGVPETGSYEKFKAEQEGSSGAEKKLAVIKAKKSQIMKHVAEDVPTADFWIAVVHAVQRRAPDLLSLRQGRWIYTGRFSTFQPEVGGKGIEVKFVLPAHDASALGRLVEIVRDVVRAC